MWVVQPLLFLLSFLLSLQQECPRVATVPALFALYPKSAPEKVPRKLFTAGASLTSWLRSAASYR